MIPRIQAVRQPEDLSQDSFKDQHGHWRQVMQNAFRKPSELLEYLGLPERLLSPQAQTDFPMRVPRGFAKRMEKNNPRDPLLLQVLPVDEETHHCADFMTDPVGDHESKAANGVLHKYHGRALLIATGACAIHCRYCFRRHFPYQQETAAKNQWQSAVEYLASDTSITEVILSGGDPLMLETHKLAALTDQLRSLPHIRRLRIHSRIPVVLPERINSTLLEWLHSLPWKTVVVIHCNHPQELTEQTHQAFSKLTAAGVTLFNQTVLLHGINDSTETQVQLSEDLFHAGVLPYYLHLLDRVQGAAHFDVAESKAVNMMKNARKILPGYLVPKLVREVKGAAYKIPVL